MSKGNDHIVQKAVLKIRLRDQKEAYAQQSAFQDMFMSLALPVIERVMDRFAGADEVIHIDSLTIDLGRLDMDNLQSEIPERVAKALGEALHRSINGGAEDQNVTWQSATSQRWEIFVAFLEQGILPWTQDLSDFDPDEYIQKLIAENPALIQSAFPAWLENPLILERLSLQLKPSTLRALVALFSQELPAYFAIFQLALRQIGGSSASPFPRSSSQLDAFVATVLLKLARNATQSSTIGVAQTELPPLNAPIRDLIAFLIRFLPDATHSPATRKSLVAKLLDGLSENLDHPVIQTPWQLLDCYLEAGQWSRPTESTLDAPVFGADKLEDLLERLLRQESIALQRYLRLLVRDVQRFSAFIRLLNPSMLVKLLNMIQPNWRELEPALLHVFSVGTALFPQFPKALEARQAMVRILILMRFCQGLDEPSGPRIETWLPILLQFWPQYYAMIQGDGSNSNSTTLDLRSQAPTLEALLTFITALDFRQFPAFIGQLNLAFLSAQTNMDWRTYFVKVLLEAIEIMLSGRWSIQWVRGLSGWFEKAAPRRDSLIWEQWQAIFNPEIVTPKLPYSEDLLAPFQTTVDSTSIEENHTASVTDNTFEKTPDPIPKAFENLSAEALLDLLTGNSSEENSFPELPKQESVLRNPLMDAPPFPFAEPNPLNPNPQRRNQTKPTGDLKSGLYVDNAGIVLLNPFFQPCFSDLGWMQGQSFIDEEAREDALMMLAFLATGEEDVQEARLPLLKLLVGMDIQRPVRMKAELSDRAKEEADTLLIAANAHWEKAGKLSPDQFRAAFLNREGRLKSTESGWNLKVDRQTIDILLEFLPWGFGTIKLPWMQRILSVDW